MATSAARISIVKVGMASCASIVLLTFFSVDVLKIIAAKKIRPLVNQTLLNGLNRLIGIVFTLFGIFLILQFFLKK